MSDRTKQAIENKKKISHLKNVDSKLANHIMDEIVEGYDVKLTTCKYFCDYTGVNLTSFALISLCVTLLLVEPQYTLMT